MAIIEIIAFLFPAAVATTIHLSKVKNKNYNKVLIYMNYVTLINLINFIFVYFIFGHNGLTFTVLFTIKYIALALFNAVILSLIAIVILNNVELGIEVKKETKNNEKRKN